MTDFLPKVPIRIPMPGTLPPHPGLGSPGLPMIEDDPTLRIEQAIIDA